MECDFCVNCTYENPDEPAFDFCPKISQFSLIFGRGEKLHKKRNEDSAIFHSCILVYKMVIWV